MVLGTRRCAVPGVELIHRYEQDIVARLGVSYRRSTLREWDDGERVCIAAENQASAWRELSVEIAKDADASLWRRAS